jgi:hypothetical protein
MEVLDKKLGEHRYTSQAMSTVFLSFQAKPENYISFPPTLTEELNLSIVPIDDGDR